MRRASQGTSGQVQTEQQTSMARSTKTFTFTDVPCLSAMNPIHPGAPPYAAVHAPTPTPQAAHAVDLCHRCPQASICQQTHSPTTAYPFTHTLFLLPHQPVMISWARSNSARPGGPYT
eukprot:scaffold241321_cov19-Tisochrysis_lutea.AAC.2